MAEKKYIEVNALFKTIEDYASTHPVMNDNELFALFCSVSIADVRHVIQCKDCWFFKKDTSFCSLHEADFAPDAFCSYATTDGLAKYWGMNKEDHDRKRREINSD